MNRASGSRSSDRRSTALAGPPCLAGKELADLALVFVGAACFVSTRAQECAQKEAIVAVNPVGQLQGDASGAGRASCRGSTRTRRPAAGSVRVQRQHNTQRTSERETSGANHLFPQLRDASDDDTRSIAHSRSGRHPVWSGNSLIHSYDISGHSRAPQVTRGRAPISSSSSTLDLHISWLRIVSTETRSAK